LDDGDPHDDMRTTLLNPTVWLLAATAVVAAVDAFKGREARQSIERVVRYGSTWPVLAVLLVLAGGGLAARIAVGYLSPGAYAEEVVAARTFLQERRLYTADSRRELQEWIAENPTPAPPWTAIPGVTQCQANALSQRGRFFTNHAHTPMLLLSGVPIVHYLGGRGLFVCLMLLSLASIAAVVAMFLAQMPERRTFRIGLLLLAAVAGWQPVLAGVKQADAVVPAAALTIAAWMLVSRGRSAAAVPGAIAATIALPAIGILPALLRCAPRVGLLAAGLFGASAAATIAVAGSGIVDGFSATVIETARTYAYSPPNYALLGRAMTLGLGTTTVVVLIAACFAFTWWSAETPDRAFGGYLMLGLLVAPVAWSQHLTLALVPAAVVFASLWRSGSAASLVVWALLILLLSLPDASAADISGALRLYLPSGPLLPATSAALLALWGWVTFGGRRRQLAARQAAVASVG
jgi:hypothetical protein